MTHTMTQAMSRTTTDSLRSQRAVVLASHRDQAQTWVGSAWRSRSVCGPREPRFQLTAQALAEIDEALLAVRRAGLPLLAVRRSDFVLGTLGHALAALARDLDSNPGFVVLKGLSADQHGTADLRTILWGLGRHLGVAVSQDATGRMLTEHVAQASEPMSTGGSDITAMLALNGPQTVTVVSSGALYNEMMRRRPDVASRLFDDIAIDRGGEELPDEQPFRMAPLACWFKGKLSVRFPRVALESARLFDGVGSFTDAHRDLFGLVDEISALPHLRHELHLDEGDIVLLHNHSVLHSREFSAAGDRSPVRARFLRLWLTSRQGRPLPAGYTWPTPGYGEVDGRGGVAPRDVIDEALSGATGQGC